MHIFTSRQRMFSVACVCHSLHRVPLNMQGTGPRSLCSPPLPRPRQHVQTCLTLTLLYRTPQTCSNLFNFDLAVQCPTHPSTDIFKLVHYVSRTKRLVYIRLKYLLILIFVHISVFRSRSESFLH